MTTRDATLTTQRLEYANTTQGYRLTTDRPLLVLEGANRLSSLGGGILEEHGDLKLFRNILFQTPHLKINARGEVQGKNFGKNFDKDIASDTRGRVIIFKRDVVFSLGGRSKGYRGSSQQMSLFACSELSKSDCRVFESNALKRVEIKGSVVLSETGRDAKVLWTLQAERLVVQDEQARYDGKQRGGKVRIVLADGTQLRGQRGGHNFVDNSGLLCGTVEVQSGEGVLTAACLRYNLQEQRYSLEPSTSERELAQRFFAL